MAKNYKLNKSELTRLRREEKMYKQFLPVLKLKQEQLQIEQLKLKRELAKRKGDFEAAKTSAMAIVPLLAEPLAIDVPAMVKATELVLGEKSIAGVKVPTLEKVVFPELEFSRFGTPPWVGRSLPRLRTFVRLHTELSVLERQYELVTRELRKATQKVNLFEKVLIPETKEAIKRIKIALGDEQVAAVGRGKIAKGKQVKAALLAAKEEAARQAGSMAAEAST
jgi:V/A-type H+-transporting ATPase subunit D